MDDQTIIKNLTFTFYKIFGTKPNSIIVPIGYEHHATYYGLRVIGYHEDSGFIVCLS
jgi:hypothetical protein